MIYAAYRSDFNDKVFAEAKLLHNMKKGSSHRYDTDDTSLVCVCSTLILLLQFKQKSVG